MNQSLDSFWSWWLNIAKKCQVTTDWLAKPSQPHWQRITNSGIDSWPFPPPRLRFASSRFWGGSKSISSVLICCIWGRSVQSSPPPKLQRRTCTSEWWIHVYWVDESIFPWRRRRRRRRGKLTLCRTVSGREDAYNNPLSLWIYPLSISLLSNSRSIDFLAESVRGNDRASSWITLSESFIKSVWIENINSQSPLRSQDSSPPQDKISTSGSGSGKLSQSRFESSWNRSLKAPSRKGRTQFEGRRLTSMSLEEDRKPEPEESIQF